MWAFAETVRIAEKERERAAPKVFRDGSLAVFKLGVYLW